MAAGHLTLLCSIVGWGALGVLCTFACLIASLFERRTGVETHAGVLAVSSAVLVATGVAESIGWQASFSNLTSVLLALSGVATVASVWRIYALMVGGVR